jgi:hypothetical protein
MGSPKKNRRGLVFGKAMPQIIARLPRRFGMTQEEWGAEIDGELIKVWKKLSKVKPARADALYKAIAGKRRRATSAVPDEGELAALGEIIIAQAVTLGWRLMTRKANSGWESSIPKSGRCSFAGATG